MLEYIKTCMDLWLVILVGSDLGWQKNLNSRISSSEIRNKFLMDTCEQLFRVF